MSGRASAAAEPDRRTVLTAATTLGLIFALAACGIRLEDDAPRIPLVPTREPVPDESALLAALVRARARRDAATGGAPAVAAARARSVEQARTLAGLLRQRGVPVPTAGAETGSPAPRTPTGSPSPSTPATNTLPATTPAAGTPPAPGTPAGSPAPSTPAGSPAPGPPAGSPAPSTPAGSTAATTSAAPAGIEALRTGPTPADLAGLARVSTANRALLGSLLLEQAVTTITLGGTVTWARHAPPSGTAAVRPLASMRASGYGLQVVTAQTDRTGLSLARAALAAVSRWQSQLQAAAGSAAGPPPVGYALPFPVTTPSAAKRLGAYLLPRSIPALVAALPATEDLPGLTWLVRAGAEAQLLAERFGAATPAFPGLTL
ncbi:MAG TPA: DUF4439 domain-containing protein [Dermatophilaceae bacterium]|nr:DUF4439 domain-containing protein [Dermatophilaceae bacterium]